MIAVQQNDLDLKYRILKFRDGHDIGHNSAAIKYATLRLRNNHSLKKQLESPELRNLGTLTRLKLTIRWWEPIYS